MPGVERPAGPDAGQEPAEQLHQAERLESLARLAAGVAHDYNNVLTVILSCAQALERALANGAPVSPDDVRQIAGAAERAGDLTRQLLAFARRQASSPVPLDLGAALVRSRSLLARLLGEGVELWLAAAPDLWPVRADPAQLEQVLLSLAANARDALPQGGRVRVEAGNLTVAAADPAWPGLAPGAYVRLSFGDDGAGMAPEVRERIFDPFFTGGRDGLGTGLRLATVHGIVSQGGGRIRVESEPGRGTRFELLLPRSEAPAAALDPEAEAEPVGGSETILLVEDDPAVRRQALRALAGAGYQVHVAGDGEEALALAPALAQPPHLLLTDVIMPRVDGPHLAEALRGRWPTLRVMFTSGYSEDRLSSDAAEGVFLQKPFTVRTLLTRVRATLDGPGGG
jgi:nitrogen-specific signal transduction histidine kinase